MSLENNSILESDLPKNNPEKKQTRREFLENLLTYVGATAAIVAIPKIALADHPAKMKQLFDKVTAELETDPRPEVQTLLSEIKRAYPQFVETVKTTNLIRYKEFQRKNQEVRHGEKKDPLGKEKWNLERPNFHFDSHDDGISGISEILQWQLLENTLSAVNSGDMLQVEGIKETFIDTPIQRLQGVR